MSKTLTATVVEIDTAALLSAGFRDEDAEFTEMMGRAPLDYERFIGLASIMDQQRKLDAARYAKFEGKLANVRVLLLDLPI